VDEVRQQRLLATFLRLTQVDSPSHAETNLAQLLIRELAERGWQVRTDCSGNVIGSRW
jgi:putative aminopeptidase FrvX